MQRIKLNILAIIMQIYTFVIIFTQIKKLSNTTTMIKKLLLVFLLTSVYTVSRYIIFGNVSPVQLPAYLLNKSVSLASVVFLFLAATNNGSEQIEKMKFWGKTAFQSAVIHILISLAILSKAYYPKFFALDKMNLTGELVIMFGVLAAFLFWRVGTTTRGLSYRRWLRIYSLILVSGHLTAMGLAGWLVPGKWNGGLPPISLIAFALAIISIILLFKSSKASADNLGQSANT